MKQEHHIESIERLFDEPFASDASGIIQIKYMLITLSRQIADLATETQEVAK